MSKTFWMLAAVAALLWARPLQAADIEKTVPLPGGGEIHVNLHSDGDVSVLTAAEEQAPAAEKAKEEKSKETPTTAKPAGPTTKTRNGAWINRSRLESASPYWLGVEVSSVSPVLRAQLGLAEKQGLVVERVAVGGPAEKAGIKQYDVVVKVGGKTLTEAAELVKTVEKAKESKLTVDLVRGGKPQTITVTPAKRPADVRVGETAPAAGDVRALAKWLEELQSHGGEGPVRFHIFHPGAILPPGAPTPMKLPDNTSVAITREGDKLAKIVVKQGEEKWEITEDQLDKLPETLRPVVEQMLGHGIFGFSIQSLALPGPDETPSGVHVGPRAATPGDYRFERRLNDMNRHIEELQKSLDELRQNRGSGQPAKTPPAPAPSPNESDN